MEHLCREVQLKMINDRVMVVMLVSRKGVLKPNSGYARQSGTTLEEKIFL